MTAAVYCPRQTVFAPGGHLLFCKGRDEFAAQTFPLVWRLREGLGLKTWRVFKKCR